MIIIPSIDLKNGQVVRLLQGDFNKTSIYNFQPQEMAKSFLDKGARALHTVDLDGAQNGKITQLDAIREIRNAFPHTLQVGGGIREDDDIEKLLNIGVNRVVIGSRAVSNIEKTIGWIEKFGSEKIVLALDFKISNGSPLLLTTGWQETTNKILWDVIANYKKLSHVLCTDISKDGMQIGPNFDFYSECKKRHPSFQIQASGGVGSLADISKLKAAGIDAAIVGKAIYENKIDLEKAIELAR
jgi:phosphoribosylformimino-5-aminoimidazole carboxamide ribotide isomerase